MKYPIDFLYRYIYIYVCVYVCIYIYIYVCIYVNVCIYVYMYMYVCVCMCICQQAFSLLVNRYLRPWVRILPSAEEDNLSPFDSNIACLCQSIEINNNKHVCMYMYIYIYIYICICMCMYMCMYVSHYVRFNCLNGYNVVPLVLKVWYSYDDTSTIMSSVDDQKPNHHQTFNPHCNDKLYLFRRLTLTVIIFFLCKHGRKLTSK